ncbi:MAG: hypothetical protein HKO77_00590 [Gemmatimonadetes bacterium]|nr:hypothetical protein [Gemmatimonadota bacterium]
MGNRIYGCDICQEVCPFNQSFAAESREPRYSARGPGERPVGVEPVPGEEVPEGSALPGTDGPGLVSLMRMTEAEWSAYTRGSALRRVGYSGFKRNVAVAMGNWLASVAAETPDGEVNGRTSMRSAAGTSVAEAIAVLEAAADEGDALIREHAEWALSRF